jgi:hypothetical protein
MKTKLALLLLNGCLFGMFFQSHAQGYIVPNGIVYAGLSPFGGYEVDVMYNPTNSYYTGFFLKPETANTFSIGKYADVGVRVFLVSANDLVSLQPILAQSYPELLSTYSFASGVPFYVGLYTGNQNFYPPDGIYTDPLFGWARLVNNNGVIQLLDSALAYRAGGIYAGTQNLIPVPEPSTVGLFALGALLLVLRLRRTS